MAKPGLQADESRKILIVDDNEDAAESLAALLQIEGHETRTACSGESALDIVPSFNPDVVVLDICLPGADGYEVALRTPPDTDRLTSERNRHEEIREHLLTLTCDVKTRLTGILSTRRIIRAPRQVGAGHAIARRKDGYKERS